MKQITPCINIKQDKIDFIVQHLCHLEEVLYASKVQIDYPLERNLPTQTGYAILSYGYIYLLTKNEKELKMEERICLFNCEEIRFNNDKSKTSKPTVLITTLPGQNLFTITEGKKLDIFYENITRAVFILSNGASSQMNAPKLYPPIQNLYYPVSFAILRRTLYYIHYDMKQLKIPRTLIDGTDYFNDPNIYHRGQLIIGPSFHPNNFITYYGKAIGMESQVTSIKFHDFKEDITTLIDSISHNSIKSQQIIFADYCTAAPVFNFEKVANSKIESFEFTTSHFCIIENFMNGCYNYNSNINSLKLSNLIIQETDILNFFDFTNKIRCFTNLKSLTLCNMQFRPFPNDVFKEFLKLHVKLEHICISCVDVDGCSILVEICKTQPNLNELHMNHVSFESEIDLSSSVIPQNLVLANFSHCRFKNSTLKPVLELLTQPFSNREIQTNLMVNMSYLQPRENMFINAFKNLDLTKCHPNIFEFNWSGNKASSDLFNFILTQKDLQFLALLEMSVEKPKPFFQCLTNVVNDMHLIGLDIGCGTFQAEFVNPFLSVCKQYNRFQHFTFCCQPEQNEIADQIADLISGLPNLKEVCLNLPKLSKDMYLKVANAIVHNKSVLACRLMKFDSDKKEARKGDVEAVLKSIQKLKKPTTMKQREDFILSNKKNLYVFDLASTIDAKPETFENYEEEEKAE